VERAIAEGKMRQKPVKIYFTNSNELKAETNETPSVTIITKTLASGFSYGNVPSPLPEGCVTNFNSSGVISENKIGISGVSDSGCFIACFNGYCGSAVKSSGKNKFVAKVRKPSANWEELK
jgi:hypothetical protein